MAFRLPTYRTFRKFIGELSAASAGLEVSVRLTALRATEDPSIDPWNTLGKKVGICLNGISSKNVRDVASRLQLVSTYSGFDAFMRGLRSDWQRVSHDHWCRAEGDSPFQEIRRNVPSGTFEVGPEENALDYYRLCRNWITHPSETSSKEASTYFDEKSAQLEEVRNHWCKVGDERAPSPTTDLSFEDVKLFARVSLHLARMIAGAFDPGDERLCCSIPIERWSRLRHDTARQRRLAAGYRQSEFGIDRVRALRIAEMAIGAN